VPSAEPDYKAHRPQAFSGIYFIFIGFESSTVDIATRSSGVYPFRQAQKLPWQVIFPLKKENFGQSIF